MKRNYEKKSFKLLDEFKNKIIIGYTHENYNDISDIINQLEYYLDYDDLLLLKEAWRDTYTDTCDLNILDSKIEAIKNYIN